MAARRVDGDRPVPAVRPRSASAAHAFGPPVPHAMVFLQRAAGNRAVTAAVTASRPAGRDAVVVQRELSAGDLRELSKELTHRLPGLDEEGLPGYESQLRKELLGLLG